LCPGRIAFPSAGESGTPGVRLVAEEKRLNVPLLQDDGGLPLFIVTGFGSGCTALFLFHPSLPDPLCAAPCGGRTFDLRPRRNRYIHYTSRLRT